MKKIVRAGVMSLLGMLVVSGCAASSSSAPNREAEQTEQESQKSKKGLTMQNSTGYEIQTLSIRASRDKKFTSLLQEDQKIEKGKNIEISIDPNAEWPSGTEGEMQIGLVDGTSFTLHNINLKALVDGENVQICLDGKTGYLKYIDSEGENVSTLDAEKKLNPEESSETGGKQERQEESPSDNADNMETEQTIPADSQEQQPVYQNPTYQQPAQQPVYQDPTYQQPVYQDPAYQQPAQQPVYQDPTYQQPVQQPVYQDPIYQQPAQQPVYQDPTYQQPVYQDPAYQQPVQ